MGKIWRRILEILGKIWRRIPEILGLRESEKQIIQRRLEKLKNS